jgi:crotonobetainyl-CoA:carnitine CoA-transferase CaiB-like acyl-CoA transferase
MTAARGNPGPLDGVRVLDLTTVIMGPYATQTLGDLGADVVKVETGDGDTSRMVGGGPHPQLSGIALNLHRNKRSISLDLKHERGKEVFLDLLDTSDVFVTNLRPEPLRRLGLAYEDVAATRPGLIYCQAHGFRSDTSAADAPAYDDIIQALTGLPRLIEAALGITFFVPSTIGDKVAGLTIVYSVLAALFHRERTGEGQRVEVPMFDAMLAFNLVEHLSRAAVVGEPAGYSRILTSNRGPHRTLDGHIAMMPYTDRQWRALFAAVGREELLNEPWFADHASRVNNAHEVYGALAAIIRERTTAEWLQLCAANGVPASPVPSIDEIVEDPERHMGVISEANHPVVGPYRQIEPAARFSKSPQSVRRTAPMVAEHTREILSELGYADSDIDRLIEQRVIAEPRPSSTLPQDAETPYPS